MKKQIHILQGLFILTLILIATLLSIKFIYNIKNEKMDTEYLWNIKFANLQIKEGSKKGNINLKDNQLSLDVELEKENEYYEFTIDIENKGTLNAKLDSIILDIDNPKKILIYKISYLDGTSLNKGDILLSKSKKTILVKIEYPKQKEKIYELLKMSLSISLKYIATD